MSGSGSDNTQPHGSNLLSPVSFSLLKLPVPPKTMPPARDQPFNTRLLEGIHKHSTILDDKYHYIMCFMQHDMRKEMGGNYKYSINTHT